MDNLAHLMSPAEVAEQLSFKEFSELCGMLDERGEDSLCVGIGGGETVMLLSRLREARFRVLRVKREPEAVRVQIITSDKFGKSKWYKLDPHERRAA